MERRNFLTRALSLPLAFLFGGKLWAKEKPIQPTNGLIDITNGFSAIKEQLARAESIEAVCCACRIAGAQRGCNWVLIRHRHLEECEGIAKRLRFTSKDGSVLRFELGASKPFSGIWNECHDGDLVWVEAQAYVEKGAVLSC